MEHDTLEDYLGIPGINEKNADKLTNILTTAQKRKRSERKALAIVQLLSQKNVSAEVFLKSLGFLNTSYYEDVAEERGLINFCGYPLCSKMITKPNQRFKICRKLKKVYDLEQYGNFCSCFCHDAYEHIKSQILDSPLWLRDVEDIPNFNLLCKKKDSGSVGIDIRLKKPEKNDDFIPVASFAKLSLEKFGDIGISVTAMNKPQASVTKNNITKLSTVMENEEEIGIKQTEQKNNPVKAQSLKANEGSMSKDLKSITNKIKNRKSCKQMVKLIDALPLKIEEPEIRNSEVGYNNKYDMKLASLKSKSLMELKFLLEDSVSVENSISSILKKWITLETLIFIHGEEKVKEILDDKKLAEHFEKLKIQQLDIEQQRKYISICRKLCEQEVFEEKVESLMIKNKLKPIPDYNALKKESKEFTIKVNSFYKGGLCEAPDPNFGENRVKEDTDGKEQSLLPLPDVTSSNAVRYQILSDTLENNIKSLLEYINYNSSSILPQMLKLLRTFDLDANNIVFKPAIRNYLSLICLRILSLKDSKLHKVLEKSEFSELENSVFEQFPGRKKVLLDTLKLINDVDNFVNSSVKS